MAYCLKCGDTGMLIDGSPCDCKLTIKDVYEDVACLEIPEQYRGVQFIKDYVPNIGNGAYQGFLDSLHTRLSTCGEKGINYIICSPPRHSKTIFAYATMRRLFKGGLPVYPLCDLYEVKTELVEATDSSPIVKTPYLFIKFPPLLNQEVFQTAALLLDRRVRHSGTTVFLYGGSWVSLCAQDRYKNFAPFAGDGSYCSVKVCDWRGGAEDDG